MDTILCEVMIRSYPEDTSSTILPNVDTHPQECTLLWTSTS